MISVHAKQMAHSRKVGEHGFGVVQGQAFHAEEVAVGKHLAVCKAEKIFAQRKGKYLTTYAKASIIQNK